jgi:hypothetical protein
MSLTDESKPYIPLAGLASDGWSNEDEATATCFCGEVQLVFVSPVDSRLMPFYAP